jgi:hypothetical protein
MGSFFLDNFKIFGEQIIKLYPGTALYATNRSCFRYKITTHFDVPFVKEGEPFAKGAPADKCIETGQAVVMELPASVYGMPLKVITLPIYDDDDNTIIGTYGVAAKRDDAFALREMADHYQRGMNEISAAIQQTAAATGEISINEQKLNQEILAIQNIAKEIRTILDYIRSVADQTKMLGLNAAIEAARAGENGRGFGVVAEEIRKLSETSKETADQIKNLTANIEEKINIASNSSAITLRSSEEQAAATEQMTASIEELTSMIGELTRIAYAI